MTVFWIVAGLMTIGALLFIALPLLKVEKSKTSSANAASNLSIHRDQMRELEADLASGTLSKAQYQSAKGELERSILEDSVPDELATPRILDGRKWIIGVVVAVPLLTVLLYFLLGKPEGITPQHKEEIAQPQVSQQQIESMVASLAKKLETNPGDGEGWGMLGRSYATLRRFNDSSAAYARAAALMPDNALLLTEYADVLAMTNGRSMIGEPEKIVLHALQVDPKNIKALALAGTAAFERKDYRRSIDLWQKMLTLVPPDSPVARSINANISQAQGLAGLPLTPPPGAAKPSADSAGSKVSGKVELAPSLKSRAASGDAVFIFARDADSQRPPLAILRKTVKDLPVAFELNDSLAAMPNFKLSSAANVVIGARISKSGNAMPAPGDLQGFSQTVKNGSAGVVVMINAEVK